MNFYFNGSMVNLERGRLLLATDFLDYYDHTFDGSTPRDSGFAFGRYANEAHGGIPMARGGWLNWLHNWVGLRVPRHGLVPKVLDAILTDLDFPLDLHAAALEQVIVLVVYTDDTAHRGEGKLRISGAQALRDYPEAYASEWVGAGEQGLVPKPEVPTSLSWRYLQIGRRKWWIEYWSENDWRSNCGEGGIQILTEERAGYHPRINHPLFAVDFVVSANRLFAVDFNAAPGLRGTGLERILPAQEVRGLIEDALHERT